MVFYLKYRPQTINELDSESVRNSLYSILSLPDLPHAFLFTGPKGLGKTSAARILAKAVNCEGRANHDSIGAKGKEQKTKSTLSSKPLAINQSVEPCNECEQCISITNGTNLDILEIDAASNRGIDEIRDLREKIRLAPASAMRKVYIIDEVHMLTTEAFNALLKTLEEPPSHAMFILCTTELFKVPDTILSRCFHVQFSAASVQDIKRVFERISEKEGLKITDEAIEQITALSGGGFRDAVKTLEELVSMGESEINSELVEKRYKVVSIKFEVLKIYESFEKRDLKGGIAIIQKIVEQGMDVKQFILQLTEVVHELLLRRAGVFRDSSFMTQDSKMEIQEIRDLLILLSRTQSEMKYAVLPQLPLELACLEWCGQVEDKVPRTESEDLDKQKDKQKVESSGKQKESENKKQESRENLTLDQMNKQTETQAKTAINSGKSSVTVSTMRKQVGEIARVKALYGEKETAVEPKNTLKVTDFSLLNISNTEITKEWIENFWRVYISEIKQYNHTIAGVLRSCRISKFDKESLVIETAYEFHRDKLKTGKTLEILESVCKTLTGSVVRVEVVLKVT